MIFAAHLLINLLRAQILVTIWQVTCTNTQILAEKRKIMNAVLIYALSNFKQYNDFEATAQYY